MWKLKNIVYGLTNPSRAWYLHVKKILEIGAVVSKLDEDIFF